MYLENHRAGDELQERFANDFQRSIN